MRKSEYKEAMRCVYRANKYGVSSIGNIGHALSPTKVTLELWLAKLKKMRGNDQRWS